MSNPFVDLPKPSRVVRGRSVRLQGRKGRTRQSLESPSRSIPARRNTSTAQFSEQLNHTPTPAAQLATLRTAQIPVCPHRSIAPNNHCGLTEPSLNLDF